MTNVVRASFAQIRFTFYGPDGVTPIAISEVEPAPEAGGFIPIGVTVLGVFGISTRRAAKKLRTISTVE